MKNIIKNIFLFGGIAAMLASCSEDSWNNHLDGFEGGANNSQVATINYTLDAADYARFANNRFNKALAAENGVEGALKAVATQQYITPATPAEEYMPNLLKDSLFRYFALNDGSAINLTYREVSQALPATMAALNNAKSYSVTERDYQYAYGSRENYALAFSPSYPASSYIPRILNDAFDEAVKNDCVLVKYSETSVDPDFNVGFEMSNAISNNLAVGADVDITGVVTGLCTRGMIVTDKGGSILVYSGTFPNDTYKVGQQVKISGVTSSYKNCLQIDYDNSAITILGEEAYTYPNPVNLTPDYLLNAAANSNPVCAVYGEMVGTIQVSGTYINLAFDGTTSVRGSIYYASDAVKAALVDGNKYSLMGYFTQTSNSGDITNCNFVVTNIESLIQAAPIDARRKTPRKIVAVPSVDKYAAFIFDGSNWQGAGSDVVVLQPADYAAMGAGTYQNLNATQAADYIPVFLRNTYPYAVADNMKYVVYRFYGADKTTSVACAQYTFNGSEWEDTITRDGVETVTNQFVLRQGVWQLDPSVELTLPAGKNQPLSTWFFQACVDWVKANVTDGEAYITSYGNNDYYTGASAYQGNIDLRASAARGQYAAAYEGMTDEEVVDLLKNRFENQVCPGVLAVLYPDMAPIGDLQPTITIHFYVYNGSSTLPAEVIYKCVAKGEFELVSANWNVEE